MNAVDTNVLIYAQDPRDLTKRRQAVQLLNSLDDGVLLWQVACEYLWTSRKLAPFGFSAKEAWSDLAELRRTWQCASPSWQCLEASSAIMAECGASFWDALLIAACVEARVDRFYSEDFGALSAIHGVTIINPFAATSP